MGHVQFHMRNVTVESRYAALRTHGLAHTWQWGKALVSFTTINSAVSPKAARSGLSAAVAALSRI